MRPSLTESLQRAWDHMVRLLFRPFDLNTWLVLGFSAWLAGLAGSSGSGGSGGNWGSRGPVSFNDGEAVADSMRNTWDYVFGNTFVLVLILTGVSLLFALVVLVTWISSRGKLIFLDNVVHRRAQIVEPWKRFQRLGNSLFWFRVVVGLVLLTMGFVLLAATGLLFLSGLGVFERPEGAIFGVLVALWVLCVFLFFLGAALFSFFQDAFVVPIMYRFDLTAVDAWKRFLSLLSKHAGSFVLCTLFVLMLSIGMAFGVLLVAVLTCCIGLVLLIIPYVGTVILLPLLVTYRAFTVEYLGQLDPDLALLGRVDGAMEPPME